MGPEARNAKYISSEKMTNEDSVLAEVLNLGIDDWVDLGWVEKSIRTFHPDLDSEQTLERCLAIVGRMLSE